MYDVGGVYNLQAVVEGGTVEGWGWKGEGQVLGVSEVFEGGGGGVDTTGGGMRGRRSR